VFWNAWDIDAETAKWEKAISPFQREIPVQEVVFLVHSVSGFFEDVVLLVY
jgi:hypothetical protein